MRQSGDQVYTSWIQGKQKFTSPEIKLGYQTFLKEVSAANVYGGSNTALSTNFGKAGDPMFKSPAGCLFLEQATFIADFFTQNFPNTKAGTDFDFFGHPSMGKTEFDGNVNGFYDQFAMYNDTPAARKLLQYLATQDAQQIWVDDGGTLGGVKSSNYKDPIFQRAAESPTAPRTCSSLPGTSCPPTCETPSGSRSSMSPRESVEPRQRAAHLDQVQAAAYRPRSGTNRFNRPGRVYSPWPPGLNG